MQYRPLAFLLLEVDWLESSFYNSRPSFKQATISKILYKLRLFSYHLLTRYSHVGHWYLCTQLYVSIIIIYILLFEFYGFE